MTKLFTIYRSSAGSGKTYTLAREYLKLALQFRSDYFKHILAVTFTNKSTQEMKDRILDYLDDFANDRQNALAEELKKILGLDDMTFRERSKEVQNYILHKYSQFSISTIDAFFQRVIRSFTRESGLVGDYRLEVEHDEVMEEVINSLIDELGSDDDLTRWVVDFAKENLFNDRTWDVRYNLLEFSEDIFKEQFKQIEKELIKQTQEKNYFPLLRETLQKTKWSFVRYIQSQARDAMAIIEKNGLDFSDFKYGGSGYKFFNDLINFTSLKEVEKFGVRITRDLADPKNWPQDKSINKALVYQLAVKELLPRMNKILEHREKYYQKALSSEVVLNNFYVFGLVADISRKLKEYKDENNMMLLADAPQFLNGVISDSDTPFIYEKVGSFYRNYLIDEFQDTSILQWKNFLPLLTNSLDQGYPGLVVGDVKQAIYRWRGGDLDLLQQQIEKEINTERVSVNELLSNFRSALHIVQFNNSIFKSAARWMKTFLGVPAVGEIYKDVQQKTSRIEAGFVHIEFIKETSSDDSWKKQSLDLIPKWLEKLQECGVALKNIAILVRKNSEGQEIISKLIQYRESEEAKENYRYDVVSNESLRIDGAASVNLIVSALKYLQNSQDDIARAQLAYENARLHAPGRELTEVFTVSEQVFFESGLPESFAKEKAHLKKLPLFELTETLIHIFGLGNQKGEIVYLQAFQDLVLEFSTRERNDIGEFLEWWEENKKKKSIQTSGEIDAVQILTIHKAKGLQFDYVIIPFCSWPLDHENWKSPTLWVKSDEEPFDKAGYLPVKYSGNMKDTYFHSYYEEEYRNTHIDNLNLLYVALTRAKLGLIVQAPHISRGAKNTIAQVLYESIMEGEDVKGWDNATQNLKLGQLPSNVSPNKNNNSLALDVYPSSSWREKLVIRQSALEYFDSDKNDVRERINFGIYIHTILSRIKHATDVDVALDEMINEGFITHEERLALSQQIEKLFIDKQVLSWFTPDWEVRTEVPILLPDGKENRIDRLLVRGRQVVIIDFKTGIPTKIDQKQVSEYMNLLYQMNYSDVEGYLLYVRTGEIIAVKTGKPKVVKKKDSNQLELGL